MIPRTVYCCGLSNIRQENDTYYNFMVWFKLRKVEILCGIDYFSGTVPVAGIGNIEVRPEDISMAIWSYWSWYYVYTYIGYVSWEIWQNGDLVGTGNERVYIDHVGYKTDGETAVVPLDSTVYHKAYFKRGSGLYGPKLELVVDGNSGNLIVNFRQISFTVVDAATQEPVNGAQVYIDHVGYVENGGTAVVPLESTIYHKAIVDSTSSEKTGKEVDETWAECIYQWDGVEFSPPSYE